MKFIQRLHFAGDAAQAIQTYQQAFGCTVRSIILYQDAVRYGWAPACPEKNGTVYHSEILFDGQEVRIFDTDDPSLPALSRMIDHQVKFQTEAEVREAFAILSDGGEVLRPLEQPPFLVIIGSVRDRFGIQWTLICDHVY